MKRAHVLRLVAWGAGAIAIVLALLTPGSSPFEESANWTRPASAIEADDLSRLVRELYPVVEHIERPVPDESGLFAVPQSLRPRVEFWKRIYTGIYSFQAIIHDSRNLDRIYGVVDLRDEPGVNPDDFDSVRNAAIRVIRRYKDHMRFLTSSQYDPSELEGERRRLYYLIRATGGFEAHKDAENTIRIQRGLRDTLRDSIIRSGRYFRRYCEIFEALGLPQELVLLPHLESSFLYQARSYAGAVGIWQLTQAASYRLLHISSVADERLDPWRSAEAAAELLRYNFQRLRDWPLAITAYNQGLNAMLSAVSRTESRDISVIVERFSSRTFGFAGRNFYCAFLAILEVVKDYEIYFGSLPVEPELQIKRHKVEVATPLHSLCEELGVDSERVALLNPALRGLAYSSTTKLPAGITLNLPLESEEVN